MPSRLSEYGFDPSLATTTNRIYSIDGVLLHMSKPIPGASETLKYLQKNHIPFILLTNGGGKLEKERVSELSSRLGLELDVSNFVQSHTPYQKLPVPKNGFKALQYPALIDELNKIVDDKGLQDKTVLVLGSDASKARHIAMDYGFKSVVTPGDILKACPEIFPFNPLKEFYDKQETLPLPKPIYDPKKTDVPLEDCLQINSILVFNDPRDWAVDIQLILDLQLSHRGYLGTYSPQNGDLSLDKSDRWQSDGQPPVVFSNRDLLWSTGYHLSRFGQGAFRSAVESVFREVVLSVEPGSTTEFKYFMFGKPQPSMYAFAQDVLKKHVSNMYGLPTEGEKDGQLELPRTIYMIGDNPASDIQGAITANKKSASLRHTSGVSNRWLPAWKACLVRSGVWKGTDACLKKLAPPLRPDIARDDVRGAVNWALEQEGWPERVE